MARYHKAEKVKEQAKIEIRRFFDLARSEFTTNPTRAHRYMDVAHSLALRTKSRFPSDMKRQFCKKCHHFLVPGNNLLVRTKEGHMIFTCRDCGHVMRFGYLKEKNERKKQRTHSVSVGLPE